MAIPTRSNRKAIFFLLFLVAIFVGPMIASYLIYNFHAFVPETMSNGHLILPPLSLQKLPLQNSKGELITTNTYQGDWIMLYVEPKQCEQTCLDTLYKMRQVRTRLGKDMDRVQRVILTLTGNQDKPLQEYLSSLYQGTIHLQTTAADLNKFINKLPSPNTAMSTGNLYLVDPLGNVMMSYNPSQNPKDIYSDLTRLLKASRIG